LSNGFLGYKGILFAKRLDFSFIKRLKAREIRKDVIGRVFGTVVVVVLMGGILTRHPI
jgi:hypothetical protein